MDGGRYSQALPPVVPMPPGDHIVVSDPFLDDFTASPATRSQSGYAINSDNGMVYNSHAPTNAIPTISVYSHYAQPPAIIYQSSPIDGEIPIGALGRLFPGDQSVIVQNSTSPTHPYIPPVFPCGLCRREILDNVQAVQCYLGCKFWFHRTCVCLSEEAFQILLKDPYAEWMCDPCYEAKKDSIDDGQYKIIQRDGYCSSS